MKGAAFFVACSALGGHRAMLEYPAQHNACVCPGHAFDPIDDVQQQVLEAYGVQLEAEVRMLNSAGLPVR